MAKWMLLLLNDGKASSGGRVLREGVLGEVFKPSNVVPPASYAASYRRPVTPVTFSGDTYGLGWKMGYYRGKSVFRGKSVLARGKSVFSVQPWLEDGILQG